MRAYLLAVPALLSVAACAEFQAQASAAGVSAPVQNACIEAAAVQIAGINEDTDFDAVMEELRDQGKACLIAALRDVVTAQLISAPKAIAGEVVAADAAAADVIAQ